MKIFDNTFYALEKAMDLRFKRHTLLSGNLANSETPQYRARELDFAGELSRAIHLDKEGLKKTHARHMDVSGSEQAHVTFDNSGAVGADGNNVDLDIQMGKLNTNSSNYQMMTEFLSTKLRLLRAIAQGRGGI